MRVLSPLSLFFACYMVAVTLCEPCSKLFNLKIIGKCQCFDDEKDPPGLKVECSETTGQALHSDIDDLSVESGKTISLLKVRDSNLTDMTDLPSGLVGIKCLILDNTNIDLQVIRESSEILSTLTTLQIFNENYTDIPEFFLTMNELKTLWLNGIGIARIADSAFQHLDDSLQELRLSENKLKTIPPAVTKLMKIDILDLTGNEITSVSEGIANDLQQTLNCVKRIKMDKINCSCGFAKSTFAAWIRQYAIKDVRCATPAKFKDCDVWPIPSEEFCNSSGLLFLPNFVLICFTYFTVKFLTFTLVD